MGAGPPTLPVAMAGRKSPSVPLYERGRSKSPFAKGDLGGFPLAVRQALGYHAHNSWVPAYLDPFLREETRE